MEEQKKYVRALIEIHRGLERQGPGDTDYSDYIISQMKCRNLYEFIGKMPTLPSALNQKTQIMQIHQVLRF